LAKPLFRCLIAFGHGAFVDRNRKISITKVAAARNQLDTAITLWFGDADAISIHTLAAAAHQIIHDLHKNKCPGKELFFNIGIIADHDRKLWVNALKEPANFAKHSNDDPDKVLEFLPFTTVGFILFSLAGMKAIGELFSDLDRTFYAYLHLHDPTLFDADTQQHLANSLPVEAANRLRSLSKGEFLQHYMKSLARLRAQGAVQ
jgi:hypothetical protein